MSYSHRLAQLANDGILPVAVAANDFYRKHKKIIDPAYSIAKDLKRKYGDRPFKVSPKKKQKTDKMPVQKSLKFGAGKKSTVMYGPQPRMIARGDVNRAAVTRTAMKVVGKTKTKRTPTVKVPSRLRKQIKQVLVGQQAVGTYKTIKEGYIGSIMPSVAGAFNGDDLGAGNNQVYYGQSDWIPGKTWFNTLCTMGLGIGASALSGAGMNYFTPAKILDAASVLFNEKTITRDPYVTTNNLSTVMNTNTGNPNPTQNGKLKINVLESYVKFSIKNVSNRVLTLEIWECMPTQMFQETNPLNTLKSIWDGFGTADPTQHTAFEYADGSGTTNTVRGFYETGIDQLEIAKSHFDYKFTWKKRTMILPPDETCIHSIRGPKGIFDYSKLQRTNTTLPIPAPITTNTCLFKGWSVGVVMAVSGDQVLVQNGVNPSQGGRKNYTLGALAVMGAPLAIEVIESYKVAVPEVAGFLTTSALPGSRQMLNLRKHRTVVFSQKEGRLEDNQRYSTSNEVNPLAEGPINNQYQ